MKAVAIISEHYFPIIGGTTFLTKHIAEHIALQGIVVHLIVPNDSFEQQTEHSATLHLHRIPIDSKIKTDLERKQRIKFIRRTNEYLKKLIQDTEISVIHVLCGIYTMRFIEFYFFKTRGIKMVATVINVPPQECGLSWNTDRLANRIKDFVLKSAIKWVNRRRIKFYPWDKYFTISDIGKRLLSQYVTSNSIKVVPLGYEPYNSVARSISRSETINLLTVGGYVPHKNYHILPFVAKQLRELDIKFRWTFIGPVRNERYYKHIVYLIRSLELENHVLVHQSMPQSEVFEYYKKADIYVQPSLEEGFCLTALDSITFSLPLVGVDGNSGAIKDFVEKGHGHMVKNTENDITNALLKIIHNPERYRYSQRELDSIVESYKWSNVVRGYIDEY